MPSIQALYNAELVQAHREAVAALRELLAAEKDPFERRKLANALLRARPVKDLPPSPRSGGEGARCSERADEGSSVPAPAHPASAIRADDFDEDDFDDPNNPANREIDALARQLQHGPDPLAALQRLEAIMKGNIDALTNNADAPKGS